MVLFDRVCSPGFVGEICMKYIEIQGFYRDRMSISCQESCEEFFQDDEKNFRMDDIWLYLTDAFCPGWREEGFV